MKYTTIVKKLLKRNKVASICVVVFSLKWVIERSLDLSINVGARFSGNRFVVFDRDIDPAGFYRSLETSLTAICIFLIWIFISEVYLKYRSH